jgi:hypothetical protein
MKRPFSINSAAGSSVLSAFDFHVHHEPNSGCWLWAGPSFDGRGGYGCFTMRRAGILQQRAHRVSWALYRGEIPADAHVLHRCDTPACVNPDHLFLGNQTKNMADKIRKGRQDKGASHGMAKLSEEQAIAIRNDSRKYKDIADEFNVSIMTVSDIKCARSWAHLGPSVGRYRRAA